MKINIYPYKEKFIINALENLSGPERGWRLDYINSENYEFDLIWSEENILEPISLDKIFEETKRLYDEWNYLEYQRLRAAAYPSIVDQLDILYHEGYDGWKATIDTIKETYPKPL